MPKQFAPLIEGRTLLEVTLHRLKGLSPRMIAVGADDHRFMISEALVNCDVDGTIILEPSAKNTAAAMALAALTVNESEALLFCPSDHHIADIQKFEYSVSNALSFVDEGNIATFGVTPNHASTAYGYIKISGTHTGHQAPESDLENIKKVFQVSKFIEKPDMVTARALIQDGGVYWNSGIFLVKASALLAAFESYASDILDTCRRALEKSKKDGNFLRPDSAIFNSCRSQSIDYAVIEKSSNIVMIPFDGDWSDVGSWASVAKLFPESSCGNRSSGSSFLIKTSNTFVHSSYRPVVAVGVSDVSIVETSDAVLVVGNDSAEDVKEAVKTLELSGISEAITHRKVARPWGFYDCVDRGDRFQVKRITVKPNSKLSLQMHEHRTEHWIVVSGIARVTCADKVFDLHENESTFIPRGVKHRLENPTQQLLEIIEVQSGSYLGEDDIIRFEDTYGRVEIGE